MAATQSLHIAGVGASAGGLEAMLPMFARMRPTGRIAYVVAQHMAKDGHDSLVARLIGRESALPVVLADDGVKLAADTVYVIPSGKNGQLCGERLDLAAPSEAHVSTPSVNVLFRSIADESRGNGIGIVLSGTGYDGMEGCKAIKAAGGLTLAQEPLDAKFDGMPLAAIEARAVDKVLPAESIGPVLAELFPGQPRPDWKAPEREPSALAKALAESSADYADPRVSDPRYRELAMLLPQILKATGIDFSSYKEDTLLRRLDKRKALLGMETAEAYQAHVHRTPDELKELQHLFLVSVSSFYRDAESFRVLEKELAQRLAAKPSGETMRVWIPGCASGDEAYTLAILLRHLSDRHPLEIVGTDLNPEALAIAREGIYRQTAVKEMPPAFIERFFSPRGQHLELAGEIKACVRFEQRDVLGGAPMEGLDLVSCRNLLIYMKSRLQDQLIKCFHQALRPQGLLFIGQSESLSFVGNSLFHAIDHYHRLFRRRH